MRHVRAGLVSAHATVGDPRNTPARADQQPTVPAESIDGSHEIARQAIGNGVRSEAAPAERVNTPPVGPHPYIAVARRRDREHRILRARPVPAS